MVPGLIVRSIRDRVASGVVVCVVFVRMCEGVVSQELQSAAKPLIHLYLQGVVAAAGIVPEIVAEIISAADHYRCGAGRVRAGCSESPSKRSPECRSYVRNE